jgi:hypothetical protein
MPPSWTEGRGVARRSGQDGASGSRIAFGVRDDKPLSSRVAKRARDPEPPSHVRRARKRARPAPAMPPSWTEGRGVARRSGQDGASGSRIAFGVRDDTPLSSRVAKRARDPEPPSHVQRARKRARPAPAMPPSWTEGRGVARRSGQDGGSGSRIAFGVRDDTPCHPGSRSGPGTQNLHRMFGVRESARVPRPRCRHHGRRDAALHAARDRTALLGPGSPSASGMTPPCHPGSRSGPGTQNLHRMFGVRESARVPRPRCRHHGRRDAALHAARDRTALLGPGSPSASGMTPPCHPGSRSGPGTQNLHRMFSVRESARVPRPRCRHHGRRDAALHAARDRTALLGPGSPSASGMTSPCHPGSRSGPGTQNLHRMFGVRESARVPRPRCRHHGRRDAALRAARDRTAALGPGSPFGARDDTPCRAQ